MPAIGNCNRMNLKEPLPHPIFLDDEGKDDCGDDTDDDYDDADGQFHDDQETMTVVCFRTAYPPTSHTDLNNK